ncbi:bacteriocin immunity protein [Bacillus atrophaeus]|uniref:bacteriocin immunity protein n=1 Tax=Bacillus atrophaeus TaxID=1452 RepID=UPI00227E1FC9|nr:bacteriocin immunity protein [Bacillus atrophaeus]MCY8858519.1 bacteriocin immunity protein [Bacillus atrophaeus]
MNKMSKEELISLVKKIMNPELEDEVVGKYIDLLEENVPHPAPSDLIFWSEEEYTAEQIVEIALNYKEE